MKRNIAGLLLALALYATPLAAIQVSYLEESPDRIWFTVVWGADPTAPLAYLEHGSNSDAGAIDEVNQIQVDLISAYEPGVPGDPMPFLNTFHLLFLDASRQFSATSIVGFTGTQVSALPGESYGAQVVYGTAQPPASVPDHTSPGLSLAIVLIVAAAGTTWVRRF
jgi:hypothetical protein